MDSLLSAVTTTFDRSDAYCGGTIDVDQVMCLACDDFFIPHRRVCAARPTTPPFGEPFSDGSSVCGPRHVRETRTTFAGVSRTFIVRMVPSIRLSPEFHAVWTTSSRCPRVFSRSELFNKSPFTLFAAFCTTLSRPSLPDVPCKQSSVGVSFCRAGLADLSRARGGVIDVVHPFFLMTFPLLLEVHRHQPLAPCTSVAHVWVDNICCYSQKFRDSMISVFRVR